MNVWPRQEALNPCNTEAIGGNPFAVLTAIVAPAILTNASSVLALGTSNRLGRVVDRTRWSMPTWPQPNPALSNTGNGWSSWIRYGYAAACF